MAINVDLTSATEIKKIYIGGQTTTPEHPYNPANEQVIVIDNIDIETLAIDEVYTVTTAITNNIYLCFIQLIGENATTHNDKVLAYQEIQPSIEVVQSESSEFSVHLTINLDIEEQTDIRVTLDYYNHSLQQFSTVHPDVVYTSNILGQNDYIYNNNLRTRLAYHSEFTGNPSSDYVDNKIVVFGDSSTRIAGEYCSYDPLTVYYWQTENIIEALNLYASTITDKESIDDKYFDDFIHSVNTHLQYSKPYLGFNNEYGSFLYWYYFDDNYMIIIYAGCNTYNNIDIVIGRNYFDGEDYYTGPVFSKFFVEDNHEFRAKLNRIFNTFYFVHSNNVYYIDVPEDTQLLYKNYALKISDSVSLNYTIRITDFHDLTLQKWTSMKAFPIEYSDLENKLIFLDESTNTFVYNLDNPPSFLEYFNASDEYKQPRGTSDKTTSHTQLYNTTIAQIQYLLKHSYNPIYLSSCLAIGYSSVYQNYMILPKLPTIDSGNNYHVNTIVSTLSISPFQELLGIDNFVAIRYNEWGAPQIKLQSLIPYLEYDLESSVQTGTEMRDRGVTIQKCTPSFSGAKPYYYHQVVLSQPGV